MPDVAVAISLALAAFTVGTLIGAVGIGGVLLVPALIYLTPLTVHQAMATALCSFVATGIAGTLAFQRRGSIDWAITVPLCAGAVLFGFVGAMLNAQTGPVALTLILAAVIAAAGLYSLLSSRRRSIPTPPASPRGRATLLFSVGATAGLGAGLTGTGGPLVSVPLMMVFGFPLLSSVGASQVIQIVASVSGTAGNIANDTIDYGMLPALVAFEVLGVLVGVKIVHAVNPALVRRAVAWLCLVLGIAMAVRELTTP